MSDKQEYVMVPREASPEMIDAYLRANDAYWKRMDEMPPPPNKWRTGTPKDATAESYRAMLQAAPPAPAMHASAPTGLKCADCHMDKEACPTCYEAWWKARHPNSQQMPDVAPPAPVAHSKSEYKRRVAMGDASILPPAPVAATGFDREYVRAYLEELLIDKIGNPHTDPEVSKFLEWLAAPVATEDHIPTMPAEDAAMLWLASVRDDFRKMADEANSTLQRRLVEMASAPVQPAPVAAPVVTDAPQLPEGFRLLPVEATDSMMDAEWNVSMSEAHSNGGVSAAAWRAMVEAAPQVTYGDGHSGVGWYMHDTDYPEEGAVFLSRAILAAQSGAGTRGDGQ